MNLAPSVQFHLSKKSVEHRQDGCVPVALEIYRLVIRGLRLDRFFSGCLLQSQTSSALTISIVAPVLVKKVHVTLFDAKQAERWVDCTAAKLGTAICFSSRGSTVTLRLCQTLVWRLELRSYQRSCHCYATTDIAKLRYQCDTPRGI